MTSSWFKDPDAVLDFRFDWSEWLANEGNDIITTSDITADAGITITDQSQTTTSATVWLSGGTAGQRYRVTNRITTAAGRIDDRTHVVTVQER